MGLRKRRCGITIRSGRCLKSTPVCSAWKPGQISLPCKTESEGIGGDARFRRQQQIFGYEPVVPLRDQECVGEYEACDNALRTLEWTFHGSQTTEMEYAERNRLRNIRKFMRRLRRRTAETARTQMEKHIRRSLQEDMLTRYRE